MQGLVLMYKAACVGIGLVLGVTIAMFLVVRVIDFVEAHELK